MRRAKRNPCSHRGDAIVGTNRRPAPLSPICASVFKRSNGHTFQFSAAPLVSSFVALSFLAGGRLQMFPHPAAAALAGGEQQRAARRVRAVVMITAPLRMIDAVAPAARRASF